MGTYRQVVIDIHTIKNSNSNSSSSSNIEDNTKTKISWTVENSKQKSILEFLSSSELIYLSVIVHACVCDCVFFSKHSRGQKKVSESRFYHSLNIPLRSESLPVPGIHISYSRLEASKAPNPPISSSMGAVVKAVCKVHLDSYMPAQQQALLNTESALQPLLRTFNNNPNVIQQLYSQVSKQTNIKHIYTKICMWTFIPQWKPINWWTDKESDAYPYNRLLFKNLKMQHLYT